MRFNGTLYTPGSIVAQGLNFVFLSLSLYYAVYANIKYRLPVFFKALNVLLIMFAFYGLLYIISGEKLAVGIDKAVSNSGYLKNILNSLLPIYAFYVFARRGLLDEKTIKFWFFVFLILAIRSFYRSYRFKLQQAAAAGSSREEFTINTGYTFVSLLPALVVFRKRPIIQYVLIALCGYFIIAGMKRGAMLSGAICLMWFLLVNLKNVPKRKKWIIIIVTGIVVAVGVYFISYMMNNSDYFLSRYESTLEGDSSRREDLYSTFFNHFIYEENPFRFLFGYGANGTLKISYNYAHNDWLEIATNQGLVGLIIYFVYFVCFYLSWRRSRGHHEAYMAIGMTLIILFMATLYSMSYNTVSRCGAMVLGYYLAAAGMAVNTKTEVNEQIE